MSDEWAAMDATAQAELVACGEVTPLELVDAAIARIEAVDSKLNAVVHRAFERGRRLAQSKELGSGPFRGVPFLMKDCGGAEAGEPHCVGMNFLSNAGWREQEDAYLTKRVREAGFVSLGRTSSPELALLPTTEPDAFGPTRNPWSLAHSSGGSSGGASAAVAAGLVPAAHASDGGGSIRGPASMCGLVGLKPTRGRCSFGPGLGERWSSFSAELVVTRSVRDTAAMLDALAGANPGDPYSAPPPARPFASEIGVAPGRLRIGFLDGAPRDIELHPECREGARGAARLLESLGHDVELSHPEVLEDPIVVATYVNIVAANIGYSLDSWGAKVGREVGQADVEPLTWALAERGRRITAPEHVANIATVHDIGRRLASWWELGFDLLLTATQAEPPPELGFISSTAQEPFRAFVRAGPYGVFTLPYNLSGQPAISLPLHWTSGDPSLPIGAQLVAPSGREDLLLRVAAQLEAAEAWSQRRPPTRA